MRFVAVGHVRRPAVSHVRELAEEIPFHSGASEQISSLPSNPLRNGEAAQEWLIEPGCNAIPECNIHDVTFEKPRYIGPGRTVMHASVRDCSASVLSMAAVAASQHGQRIRPLRCILCQL
jgi:hypothetical protein